MKYSKRYIAFTIIMALLLLLKFNTVSERSTQIGQFRGGELTGEVWNELVAKDVNGDLLTAIIDAKHYTNEGQNIFMDANRNIMIPVSLLRDALNCSAHVYSDEDVLVEKHELSVHLTPVKHGDEYYVNLEDLSELLEYSYSFDIAEKTIVSTDTSTSNTIIPNRYDLRIRDRVSSIYNQGSYGTCWAFAAISAMESSMLPERGYAFSVDHMTMSNAFNSNQYDGGEYTMGMAYLASWMGPVLESDDPYGDGVSDNTLSEVVHVQEMQVIEGKNYEAIKSAVLKYGGVQTSLYSTLNNASSNSQYYNARKAAYCYRGAEKPNHDVVIVGWDDNYPKENFNSELEGNGAFICQNSWGTTFGENGFFYVSYYDTNVGTHNVVYTNVEGVDNYDHIYQSDLCGWVGQMGYDQESIYGANVFTAESDETLSAVSFYATGTQTKYKAYVVKNFKSEASFNHMEEIASGTVDQAGYYTIQAQKEISLKEGERYAVVMYIDTPGASHPLAIEYDTGDFNLTTIDLDDGEGYISYNGSKFVDVKTKRNCNLCIKAFTKNR